MTICQRLIPIKQLPSEAIEANNINAIDTSVSTELKMGSSFDGLFIYGEFDPGSG